jgi:hypothetical protein
MAEDSKQTTNAAPDNPALTEALQQVNANVADIKTRMEAIEKRQAFLFHSTHHEHEGRESSRLVITGLFGLLGAKLGAAIGLKAVAFQHGKNSLGEGATWLERVKKFDWGKFFDVREAFGTGPQMKKAFLLTASVTAAGTLLGVAIGWVRGKRIKQPKDILEHPLKTIETLVMSEKSYEAQTKREQALENEELRRLSGSWQERVSQPSVSPILTK